jgi:cyclase
LRRVRVIPILTLQNERLVKTIGFKNPKYIGDPINAVKIFNEKEVDEIAIVDISATLEKRPPNFERIEEIASEAFMPLAYGGGISNISQIEKIFSLGVEKVVINSSIENNFDLIRKTANQYGSQSVIASVDIKTNFLGKIGAYRNSGKIKIKHKLIEYIKKLEDEGVGEIFLTSIDRDGTYSGYDTDLIKLVSSNCNIPVVSLGGAKSIQCFKNAIQSGASAVAASSIFIFSSKGKGVLITYPPQKKLIEELYNKI